MIKFPMFDREPKFLTIITAVVLICSAILIIGLVLTFFYSLGMHPLWMIAFILFGWLNIAFHLGHFTIGK